MFSKSKATKDGLQLQCKPCKNLSSKAYHTLNPENRKIYNEKFKTTNPEYYSNYITQNQESIKKHGLKWYNNNKEHVKNKSKIWRDNNKDYFLNYYNSRIEYDPKFKLTHDIRALIYGGFKRVCDGTYKKGKKTESILDCTLKEFTQHLQSLFTEGMTLKNHGEWEIDHIIPISSAKNEEEIYKLNHYTNFQPLWKEDNRKKSNKMLGY